MLSPQFAAICLTPTCNLQLTERQRGNEYYRRGEMDQAMHHYTRAKSIVDIVSGMGKTEQEEIEKNKVRLLLVSQCFA